MPYSGAPYHPIIYVRGYAMTKREQDETAADPFCGFNLGSTVYRATPDKERPAKKFIFESPVLRLMSDYHYADVYDNGLDIMDEDWGQAAIPPRSIIIHRYYDQASKLLGDGVTPEITHFAKELSDLILRVRELVCAHKECSMTVSDFRCYLVAHSMGGLVCRAFLQNPGLGSAEARACVDKVFTYATPHNGIDMAGLNVPDWLGLNDTNNFNRSKMAGYLDLEGVYGKTKRVDWMPEEIFPSERFFCMIGTNRLDYEVAKGLSRTFVGHGSDGLVKVANASVWGINAKGALSAPSPTAYCYRSHSGFFGIVNSEEAYQNLVRFLFGDVKVDIWLDIDSVRLPKALEGKPVNALYQFEVQVAPRAKRWYLTRRKAEEDSVACRTHQQLMDPKDREARRVYLSSVFLANSARVNLNRPSLAYNVDLAVCTPDYEVEKVFWPDEHYEGRKLLNASITVEITPPQVSGGQWKVECTSPSDTVQAVSGSMDYKTLKNGKVEVKVPFDSKTSPGLSGNVRFLISAWNA